MKKYSYVGISFVILIFGIIVFPKIMDRIENQSINDTKRLSLSDDLSFIKLDGKNRKVEDFLFLNQDQSCFPILFFDLILSTKYQLVFQLVR